MLRPLIPLVILVLVSCVVGYTPPPEVLDLTATRPPRPTPTLTPEAVLDAPPELRNPEAGASLNLDSATISLAWIYHRPLEPGEIFEVLAGRQGDNLQHVVYSQSNGKDVTDWFLQREPGWYQWTVRVMKHRDQQNTFRQISYSAPSHAIEITGSDT